MRDWVLLAYRLPREPSTPRITLWRSLRRLGAIQVSDGLAALPLDPFTREQLDWLAAAVEDASGEASVWTARATTREQDDRWTRRMTEAITLEYEALIDQARAAGQAPEPARRRSLRQLRSELRRVRARDHVHAAAEARADASVEALARNEEEARRDEVGDQDRHARRPDGLRVADPAVHRPGGDVRVRPRSRGRAV
jgi:hypothetical protein